MNTCARIIAVSFCVTLLVSAAPAANFSGSSKDITDFTNGSEVSTRGTFVEAVKLLNQNVDGVGVSATVNGVLFKGTAPGQFFEGGEDFANASFVYHGGDGYSDNNLWTSGGAYDTFADSQIFNIDNVATAGEGFGVVNLVPGTLYQLQVFMLDDRSGINKTFPLQFEQVKWTGDFDNIDSSSPPTQIGFISDITIGGNEVTQANGEIATVYFTIDAEYNGLLVNPWGSGAFNGLQLRQLGLLADYDANGSVGPEDYDVWRANFGSTSNLNADGNLDGVVNAADYVLWRDASQAGSGNGLSSGAAVPEPGAILFALIGALLATCTHRLRPRFA
jgi:hypothetical protein